MKTGIERIAAERQRQIEVEGWTVEHDANHNDGSLSAAGSAYGRIASTQLRMSLHVVPVGPPDLGWPWSDTWWKPSADPIRNLEKAGALIAAEIDKLLRVSTEESGK